MSLVQSKTEYLTVPATAKSKNLKKFTLQEVSAVSKLIYYQIVFYFILSVFKGLIEY